MKIRKEHLVCTLIFFISFIVLLCRCFKGFAWNDECFYLSTVNRFYLGDRMLLDEWHVTQMFAILLVPLEAIYRSLTGGTEGIMLFFRIAYLVFTCLVSIYIWIVLNKKNSIWIACAAALLNLYYAKLAIAAFSYNTVATEMLIVASLLIYSWYETDAKNHIKIILSGTTFAMAVLGNPLLAVIEILVLTSIVVYCVYTKNTKPIKIYMGHIAGILIIAVPLLVWWMGRTSISEIITCISGMFANSDHQVGGMLGRVFAALKSIIKQYLYTIVPYGVLLLLSVKQYVKKEEKPNSKKWFFIIQTVIFGINIFLSGIGKDIGIAFIAFTMYGVALYFILGCNNVNAVYWFVIGITSAFLFFIASDTGIRSLGTGGLLSSIGTLILIQDIITQCNEKKIANKAYQITKYVLGVLVVLVIVSTAWSRVTYFFREARWPYLDYQIEVGPAKGLYTTEENREQYNWVYEAVVNNVSDEDTFLVTKLAPWVYMCTDAKCGGYTTWLTRFADEALEEYYAIFPDRVPNKILVLNEDIGYKNNDNPSGGFLEELLMEKEKNVTRKKLKCGEMITIN